MDQAVGKRREEAVEVKAGRVRLKGILGLPASMAGVVLFAHGSGSGRLSPRNTFVAHMLQDGGLATLLIDLLEEREADDRRKVFDIDLLADRLLAATEWLAQEPMTKGFQFGYFGASPRPWRRSSRAAEGPIWPHRTWHGWRPRLC